jgi:hypothetical protein
MKLKLTERQYKLLKEQRKRAYSFDWDDNILNMPTQIHLEYRIGDWDAWVPVSISTDKFRSIRHKIGDDFRYKNNSIEESFADFRSYDAFIRDTKQALEWSRGKGPSFNKFIEALKYGNDFSIITARGNPPESIKEAIKIIIDREIRGEDREEMMENLNGLTIDEYLNLQDYHPVTSKEFGKRFGIEDVATNPERGKQIALQNFVDRVMKKVDGIVSKPEYEGVSVGFSDDDLGNIEAVESFIEEELKRKYPDVKFLVYDTSDPDNPKKKRIIIRR